MTLSDLHSFVWWEGTYVRKKRRGRKEKRRKRWKEKEKKEEKGVSGIRTEEEDGTCEEEEKRERKE